MGLPLRRQAHGASPSTPIVAALDAAEAWAAEPEEANRRDAEAAAVAAGVGTPAGCAAWPPSGAAAASAPPTSRRSHHRRG